MGAEPSNGLSVRISRFSEGTRMLGPGLRAVVWVQGCPLRCQGCLAPEALTFDGGTEIRTRELTARILDIAPAVDGVTFSGGEPFAQAASLAELSRWLRDARPDISLMAFSGYTLEHLTARGNDAQRGLLQMLDILVDGPYLRRRHAPLRWRGSTNQRLLRLSARHLDEELSPDESAGIEIEIRPDSSIGFVGVPPMPGFRAAISQSLHAGELEIA
jgi:anaerobic ribonucleoside-triphosphate reductase activating protein